MNRCSILFYLLLLLIPTRRQLNKPNSKLKLLSCTHNHMKKLVFVLKKGAGEQVKEFLERTFLNQGTAKIVVDRDNPVVVTFKNKSQTVHFRANCFFGTIVGLHNIEVEAKV